MWTVLQVDISNNHSKEISKFSVHSLLGAMFPLPRIIYAMSSDGLLFKAMGKVHPRFQTPFLGTLLAGTFTGKKSDIRQKNLLKITQGLL